MATQAIERPSRRLELVERRLEDPSFVSEEQREAVTAEADSFVRACPGSGKTRTVGLRLAYSAAKWPQAPVAALSHTNVAVRAIRAAAQDLLTLPDHYFTGTLHSFILRFIVYPYGHLLMGTDHRPEVVGEHDRDWPDDVQDTSHPEWRMCRIKPWNFHVQLDGSFRYHPIPVRWPNELTEELIVERFSDWAGTQKRALWNRGLLSFSDVLYLGVKTLERHPELKDAVAARFGQLILDEAQDTSDLQRRILELLRTGAKRPDLVVTGDPDQAVYEWGGARPAELRSFVDDQDLQALPLSRNYRSSQEICDVTYRFSTRGQADQAAGPNASLQVVPELWPYGKGQEDDLVTRFRERLDQHDLDQDRSAILVRTNDLADKVNGWKSRTGSIHWLLEIVGSAAMARDHGDPDGEVFKALDRALAFLAYGETQPVGLSVDQRYALRSAGAELLATLPTVQGSLGDWNKEARSKLGEQAQALSAPEEPVRQVNRLLTAKRDYDELDAAEVLEPAPRAIARTIHDAKGENLAGVLLLARERDAEAWTAGIWREAPPDETAEETRVAYVALTRAESFLAVALPDNSADEMVRSWTEIGFSKPD